MENKNIDLIKEIISIEKKTRHRYYKEIDSLIWKEIIYYWMNVLVDSVFKYIKWEHFYKWAKISPDTSDEILKKINKKRDELIFPEMKAIYIVKLKDKKDIEKIWEEYIYMNTNALSHSVSLEFLM